MEKESTNIIKMRHIVEDFNGFKANNDINLTLREGKILALLGGNGAGKSTLMSILSGLSKPTPGEIYVRGKKVVIDGPNVAKDLKIGMVHQHFALTKASTVLENIILGHETKRGIKLDSKTARKQIMAFSEKYGLTIDPDAKIVNITVARQQRVEILKILYRGADILVLDEPTAILTPQEIIGLINTMKNLRNEGKSIILIIHKLNKIKQSADRVTTIRYDKSIGTVDIEGATDESLAEMMVSRHTSFNLPKKETKVGKTVLPVKDLKVNEDRGMFAIKGLTFDVHAGEVLGLAGIDGNSQDELVEALAGLRHVKVDHFTIKGTGMTNKRPRKITELGISHVLADRQKSGLILGMSLAGNTALQAYHQKPYSNHGIIDHEAITEHAKGLIKKFDVRTKDENLKAGELSGGSQQKAIVARELDRNSNLIIVFQPTRGLDVGATEYIHKQLLAQRDAGRVVLLTSYELDETMQLSDRTIVLHNGQESGRALPERTSERELGLLMTGAHKKEGTN